MVLVVYKVSHWRLGNLGNSFASPTELYNTEPLSHQVTVAMPDTSEVVGPGLFGKSLSNDSISCLTSE